jgi:hypothetical protein
MALMPLNGGLKKMVGHLQKWVSGFMMAGLNDLDLHIDYWMDTVKGFSPWSSYIKREIVR